MAYNLGNDKRTKVVVEDGGKLMNIATALQQLMGPPGVVHNPNELGVSAGPDRGTKGQGV